MALNPRRMDDLNAIEQVHREAFDYPHMQLWDKSRLEQHLGSKIYQGALFDSNSGHLHPLNYCLGLAKACLQSGVQIYNRLSLIYILQHPKSP